MLYIVHIAVDEGRADEWETWMEEVHIPDVMMTDCFTRAYLARDPDKDTPSRRAYRVLYRAKDRDALQLYETKHADKLQAEHTERYDGAFEASRDILPLLVEF